MTEKYSDVSICGKPFELYGITGIVISEKTWSETHVSGTGGGASAHIYNGTGSMSSSGGKISSTSTRHDSFILSDLDNDEKSFEFTGMDISCRPGNFMTVIWAIPKGMTSGKHWFVYNHDTRKIYFTSAMPKAFNMPGWRHWLALCCGLALAFVVHELGLPALTGGPWQHWVLLPGAFWIGNLVLWARVSQTFGEFQRSKQYESLFAAIHQKAADLKLRVQKPQSPASESSPSPSAPPSLPPKPAARPYYYLDSTQQAQGPVDIERLRSMRVQGVLDDASWVAGEGDKEWLPLGSLLGSNPRLSSPT